jgi:hypothetical protein
MIEYGTLRNASGSRPKTLVVDLWTHTTEGLTGGARATTPDMTADVIPSVVDPVARPNANPSDSRPGLQALKTAHEVHVELAVEEVGHVEIADHVEIVHHVEIVGHVERVPHVGIVDHVQTVGHFEGQVEF